jgi:hypothetical protein
MGEVQAWQALLARKRLAAAPDAQRLFSIFNAMFDADQMSSFGDYIELSMQSQYNKRDVQSHFPILLATVSHMLHTPAVGTRHALAIPMLETMSGRGV